MTMPVARAIVLLFAASALAQSPQPAAVEKPRDPVFVGTGEHRYEWVHDWGRQSEELGNTHGGLVLDHEGRLLVNTDTEQAVLAFSADGKLLDSWGKEWKGGLHGMTLRTEAGVQYLYLTHTNRHEALKTTLDGKVLWTIGWPEGSGIYGKEQDYKPTAIAVAPDGRIYVADGYGKSWVHLYDKDRNYRKSIGGPGDQKGQFHTPHGLLMDTRGKQPLLLVCDRENHRLQWFDLDGNFVRMMDKDLRRPCNVCPTPDGGLAVADLAGRVTLLDKDDLVVAQLGDNPDEKLRAQNGVGRAQWQDGVFLSPHSVCADAAGNLYVMDWNSLGRISKLVKVK